MKTLRCVIMRGGTSKGVFFHENELPQDSGERTKVILRVFGSPDRRQVDGLGGADILTSKVAIVGPPSRKDADVDYVFGQVGITEPEIDFSTICGNLSAAVGPFAIDEGLVRARGPVTLVRIFCPNVGRYLVSEMRVAEGKFVPEGDYRIDGAPGTGSKVSLDFADTAGLITGRILPTGKVRDVVKVENTGDLEVTVVDAANVAVFVRAADLGLSGTESPAWIDGNRGLVETIEKIRMAAAELVGLHRELDSWKRGVSPLLPILALVRGPVAPAGSGAVGADIVSRMYGGGMTHKAYAVTGAICAAVAARTTGTVVNEVVSPEAGGRETIVLGHPSGVIPVEVRVGQVPDGTRLERAVIYRTARRIMDGRVYV